MSEIERNLVVFVIGEQGKLRSPSLQNWISSQREFELHFVSPVFERFSTAPSYLRTYLNLHYAHKLTDGEWGCSIAHLRAQELAAEFNVSSALFLEDDAVVDAEFTHSIETSLRLGILTTAVPIALHGYFNPKSLDPNREALASVLPFPPVYAIGYMLNRSAIRVAVASSFAHLPVGKADFPSWSASVSWFSTPHPLALGHNELDSVVGDRPTASRRSGFFWQIVLVSLRLILSISPTPVKLNKFKWEIEAFVLGSRLVSRLGRRSTAE